MPPIIWMIYHTGRVPPDPGPGNLLGPADKMGLRLCKNGISDEVGSGRAGSAGNDQALIVWMSGWVPNIWIIRFMLWARTLRLISARTFLWVW